MGALAFYTVVNIVFLFAWLAVLGLIFGGGWRSVRSRNFWTGGRATAQDPPIQPWMHVFAVALAAATAFLWVWVYHWPFPRLDRLLFPELPDSDIQFSLSYPFFASVAARTAIFGFMIAVAVYVWYWERCGISRRTEQAVREAADDIFRESRGSLSRGKLHERLFSIVRRDNLADVSLVLVLLLAIVFTEAPGVLRHMTAEVTTDGALRLAMRPAERSQERSSVPSAQQSSNSKPALQASSELLGLMYRRLENDFESICVLHASDALGRDLFDSSQTAHIRALQSCNRPFPAPLLQGFWNDPLPSLLQEKLLPGDTKMENAKTDLELLRRYHDIAQGRTRAMALCLAQMADAQDRGVLLRAALQPLMVSYMRLLQTLQGQGFARATPLSSADADIRAYAQTIAKLADPANPGRLDATRSGFCGPALSFARNLAAEIVAAEEGELPFCPSDPEEAASRPESEALCTLMELEGILPYGHFVLALFVYPDNPLEAALILERWQHLSDTQRGTFGGQKPSVLAQNWLRYVMANQRNMFLNAVDGNSPAGSAGERLESLHPGATPHKLLQAHAKTFEEIARANDGKICEEPALQRLTLLLLLEYEGYMISLDRKLQRFDPVALEDAFANRILQRDYEKVERIEGLLPCFGNWPLQQKVDGMRGAEFHHLAAKYKRHYADFLDSTAGRDLLRALPDNTPRLLRRQAIDHLDKALGYFQPLLDNCRKQVNLTPFETRFCNPLNMPTPPSGYDASQRAMTTAIDSLADTERELRQLKSYLIATVD